MKSRNFSNKRCYFSVGYKLKKKTFTSQLNSKMEESNCTDCFINGVSKIGRIKRLLSSMENVYVITIVVFI